MDFSTIYRYFNDILDVWTKEREGEDKERMRSVEWLI